MSALGWPPSWVLDLTPIVGFGIPPNAITSSIEGQCDTESFSTKDKDRVCIAFLDEFSKGIGDSPTILIGEAFLIVP
jgi:hypothetical protein